jgi:hypothetical protein
MSNPDSIKNYFGGTPLINQWGEAYGGFPGGCPIPSSHDAQTSPSAPTSEIASGKSATMTKLAQFQPPI